MGCFFVYTDMRNINKTLPCFVKPKPFPSSKDGNENRCATFKDICLVFTEE